MIHFTWEFTVMKAIKQSEQMNVNLMICSLVTSHPCLATLALVWHNFPLQTTTISIKFWRVHVTMFTEVFPLTAGSSGWVKSVQAEASSSLPTFEQWKRKQQKVSVKKDRLSQKGYFNIVDGWVFIYLFLICSKCCSHIHQLTNFFP